MLVLSRKTGEQIQIGDQITVTVVRLAGNMVRLGIQAPSGMVIYRQELVDGPHQEFHRDPSNIASGRQD